MKLDCFMRGDRYALRLTDGHYTVIGNMNVISELELYPDLVPQAIKIIQEYFPKEVQGSLLGMIENKRCLYVNRTIHMMIVKCSDNLMQYIHDNFSDEEIKKSMKRTFRKNKTTTYRDAYTVLCMEHFRHTLPELMTKRFEELFTKI